MKTTAPVWSFRGKLSAVHVEKVPGPGSYSPTAITLPSSPKYRVGTSPRKLALRTPSTPGPGTYQATHAPDSPSWSFYGRSSRIITRQTTDQPGPGQYSFSSGVSSPKYSVGKSLRKSLELSSKIPGPGTYDQSIPLSNSKNFFSKSRKSFLNRNTGPGPGDYEISPIKDLPSYSFRLKSPEKNKNLNPGPGNYEPNFEFIKEAKPKWRIGKKDDAMSSVQVPGPGTYEFTDGFNGPKWGFSKSVRKDLETSRSPGPGSYEIKSTVGAVQPYVVL